MIRLGNAFGILWSAGTALGFARILLGLSRIASLLRHTRALTEPESRKVRSLVVAVPRHLSIRVSPAPVVPFLMGFRSATIVVPELYLTELPDDQLRMILRHEFGHFNQRDHQLAWLQSTAVCLNWWNPLVHDLSSQLTHLREEISDHEVIAGSPGFARQAYSRLLLRIAEECCRPPRYACALAATSTFRSLQSRLIRLQSVDPANYARPSRWLAPLGLAAVAVLAVVCGCRVSAQTSAPEKPVPDVKASVEDAPASAPYDLAGRPIGPSISLDIKFLEMPNTGDLPEQWPDNYRAMTGREFEDFLRSANEHHNADLLSSPKILATPGQTAKVEITHPTPVPAASQTASASSAEGTEPNSINAGISLEITPTLDGDIVRVAGSAVLRELDSRSPAPDSESKAGNGSSGEFVSFNTVETFFDSRIGDQQTLVIVCRKAPHQRKRLYIAITAELIKSAQAQAAGPANLSPQSVSSRSKPLVSLHAWTLSSGTGNAALSGANLPSLVFEGDGSPADLSPSARIGGVFTDPQFQVLARALKQTNGVSFSDAGATLVGPGAENSLKVRDLPLSVVATPGADGYTIDLTFNPDPDESDPDKVTSFTVTVWDGQATLVHLPHLKKSVFVAAWLFDPEGREQ